MDTYGTAKVTRHSPQGDTTVPVKNSPWDRGWGVFPTNGLEMSWEWLVTDGVTVRYDGDELSIEIEE